MKSRNKSGKFEISLLDNGIHSLVRGIKAYDQFDKGHDDQMLLKDAIMFVHHGVELLMKEVLVRRSPFLIFENLTTAAKKQKEADDTKIGIFFLAQPPKTISFDDAITRVDGFTVQLDENLKSNLDKLNRFRNQLEHYAIDVSVEEVILLLGDLRSPLIQFFESQIGGIQARLTRQVNVIWENAEKEAISEKELRDEVIEVMKQFHGQVVPGYIFGTDGNFTLPQLTNVDSEHNVLDYGFDIFGEGNKNWVVELKSGKRKLGPEVIDQLEKYLDSIEAQGWIVTFSDISETFRQKALESGILVTGRNEWYELKRRLGLD